MENMKVDKLHCWRSFLNFRYFNAKQEKHRAVSQHIRAGASHQGHTHPTRDNPA
ncbi:predicted protein [Plenodomus lingam JN3]|uniref:Predicted protein n=1 Tax=Leptosphaeria maculans (strain JN3 / isolate v23.1.3 / race Av1-4-5-6-7-8) TaxID=985895 RepID=E4ZHF5_LEPMJ|nr:predicted protein [Plenodomus lingam JN3]CBX90725.1 predicted protein [Plenodomus lingam JN3]